MCACESSDISIAIVSILAIFFDILARKLFKKVVDFLRYKELLNEPEPPLAGNLLREVTELRKITSQISDEKEILKSVYLKIVNDDESSLMGLQKMHESFEDLHNQIKCRFVAISNENRSRYHQVQEMVLNLRNEVLVLQVQVEQTDNLLKSQKLAHLEDEPSEICKDFAEVSSQTEESCEIIPITVSDSGVSEVEWMPLKQCVFVAIIESEKLKKDAILRMFNNFRKEYERTKALIINCWDGINEEITSCNSLLDKVHHVKQTILGIHIVLHQQFVDAQTIRETLRFYDYKFKKSIRGNVVRRNKNNVCRQVALDSLHNAHAALNVGSLAFEDNSKDVAQKLDCLSNMVTQFGFTAKLLKNDAEHCMCSMEKNVSNLITNTSNLSAKIDGDYCQEISRLSEKLLAPGEKLYVFYKTLEELRALADDLKFPSRHSSSNKWTGNLESKKRAVALISGIRTKSEESKSNKGNFRKIINISAYTSFEEALNQILTYNELDKNSKVGKARKGLDIALRDISNDYQTESFNTLATE